MSASLPQQPNAVPDLTGRTFGDFQAIRRLGQGGMGEVYLAEQTSLKRRVALKLLRPDLAANPTAVGRFRSEAEAVARINHPNIVQVYLVGEVDGKPFMALEYVDGLNLREHLGRKGVMDVSTALSVMRQVAAALQRASETGIVHRDIKPENILITRHGEAKVTDFGLSRVFGIEDRPNLTQSGVTMGTPLYMSPEQVQGHPIDPRSDIYSFGVTCYHMLAGQPPFSGRNSFDIGLKHVSDAPLPLGIIRPEVPSLLANLIERMMAKDPAGRPQTGREVIQALDQLSGGGPNEQPPTWRAASSPSQSLDRWVLLGAALAAAVAGVLARKWLSPSPAPKAITIPEAGPGEDERFLLDLAQRYGATSLGNPANVQAALRVYTQLLVQYIDQRRFREAAELLSQVSDRDPALVFVRNVFDGILAALEDRPDRALVSLQAAFADRNAQRYLSYITVPPSREGVDLRSLLVDALDRVARTHPLPPDLVRARTDGLNSLRRPGPAAGKSGKSA